MKFVILFTGFIAFVGVCFSPVFYSHWEDHRDIKKIESIQWNISTGGNGVYTSQDGKYRLWVSHPSLPAMGHEGDPDGSFYFEYMGGGNYIGHPPAETMKTFAKR